MAHYKTYQYFLCLLVPAVLACAIFGVFFVDPILQRTSHQYLGFVMKLIGLTSAVFSPILASVAARVNPGILEWIEPGFPDSDRIPADACKVCFADRGVGNSKKAHHCRTCNHCVAGFDHHCGVLGVCIGENNRRYFVGLLFLGALGLDILFYGTSTAIWATRVAGNPPNILMLNIPLLMLISPAFIMAVFAAFHVALYAAGSSTHSVNKMSNGRSGNSNMTLPSNPLEVEGCLPRVGSVSEQVPPAGADGWAQVKQADAAERNFRNSSSSSNWSAGDHAFHQSHKIKLPFAPTQAAKVTQLTAVAVVEAGIAWGLFATGVQFWVVAVCSLAAIVATHKLLLTDYHSRSNHLHWECASSHNSSGGASSAIGSVGSSMERKWTCPRFVCKVGLLANRSNLVPYSITGIHMPQCAQCAQCAQCV
jgi:hypothetical protein